MSSGSSWLFIVILTETCRYSFIQTENWMTIVNCKFLCELGVGGRGGWWCWLQSFVYKYTGLIYKHRVIFFQPVQEPEKMTRIIVEALEITGHRGIINKGWGGLGNCKFILFLLISHPMFLAVFI